MEQWCLDSQQHFTRMGESLTRSYEWSWGVLYPLKSSSHIMTAQLCCLQSAMAFDSPPPPSSSSADSLHQILYLLNSPTTCLCRRNVCSVRPQQPPLHAASFCLHFGSRRQERERQRKVNRWTAAVAGLPNRTVQPAASLISRFSSFSFQDLFPPLSVAMCQWVFCLEY